MKIKRKKYGTWRVSPEDYRNLKNKLEKLRKKFALYGKSAERDHLELLEAYITLRYHPVVQFLQWLRIVPRV